MSEVSKDRFDLRFQNVLHVPQKNVSHIVSRSKTQVTHFILVRIFVCTYWRIIGHRIQLIYVHWIPVYVMNWLKL
jgi:hypothetical protein